MAFDQGFKNTIDSAASDKRWNEYDCIIVSAINTFDRHLRKMNTRGYTTLDWHIVKGMIWVETGGPTKKAWKDKPMQIGANPLDQGLDTILKRLEGSDLIIPPEFALELRDRNRIKNDPIINIHAGIAYLLTRMALKGLADVKDPNDTKVYEYKAKNNDGFSKIASNCGSTESVVREMNPDVSMVKPGMIIKYVKASTRRVITGWRPFTSLNIYERYNNNRKKSEDTKIPDYAEKLDYCMKVMAGKD